MNKFSEKYDRVVSFVSVHQAVKAERILQNKDIDFIIVPTPRAISVSCGQCMFFLASDEKNILQNFEDNKIIYNKIFIRNIDKNKYEEIQKR